MANRTKSPNASDGSLGGGGSDGSDEVEVLPTLFARCSGVSLLDALVEVTEEVACCIRHKPRGG